jgi:hypothetical protein
MPSENSEPTSGREMKVQHLVLKRDPKTIAEMTKSQRELDAFHAEEQRKQRQAFLRLLKRY